MPTKIRSVSKVSPLCNKTHKASPDSMRGVAYYLAQKNSHLSRKVASAIADS